MIISHKHRFIFLKTNKTAGTSLEIALSEFCGTDDIITPISSADESIRRGLGYRGPQNYLIPFWAYNPLDWAVFLLKRREKQRYYNHIAAKKVRKYVGEKVWRSYYKF